MVLFHPFLHNKHNPKERLTKKSAEINAFNIIFLPPKSLLLKEKSKMLHQCCTNKKEVCRILLIFSTLLSFACTQTRGRTGTPCGIGV